MAATGTRAAILDAVLDLLAENGSRVTYDVVAARAGLARQTVYTHFPKRADLLVAAADHARVRHGADEAAKPIFEAASPVDALRALVDFHVSFTPRVLPAYVAVERERSTDPDVEAAFARRPTGRRHLAGHVATRLHDAGALAPPWTITTATDLLSSLCSGSMTSQLLAGAGWSAAELQHRLLAVFERTLVQPTMEEHP